ncbi:HvfC/BufC family peptide modification chaperone [Sorangium sp. So ce131]|uniref:HvfC/BufC family peptide modification chaperone n=1 Tax=Sorangium sp. So ce131 TaxID=3133282 RepID=UPI003F5DAF84
MRAPHDDDVPRPAGVAALAEVAPPAGLAALMGELTRMFTRGAPLPDDAELAARCGALVAGSARLAPAEQADIYRRQFWVRHTDALLEDHPGLAHVLGEDGFDAFARAYLAAHPPARFSLRDLGAHIADFASVYSGFPPALRDLARDMARYELALVDVFDGAAPPPLDPAKVTGMPDEGWTTARLVLHPLLALMELRYPVHLLRSELRQGKKPALPEPRPVHLAVFRAADLTIRCEALEPPAFALLQALGRGAPLADACEEVAAGAAAGADEAAPAALAARLGTWFQQWTSWGLIVDIAPGSRAGDAKMAR